MSRGCWLKFHLPPFRRRSNSQSVCLHNDSALTNNTLLASTFIHSIVIHEHAKAKNYVVNTAKLSSIHETRRQHWEMMKRPASESLVETVSRASWPHGNRTLAYGEIFCCSARLCNSAAQQIHNNNPSASANSNYSMHWFTFEQTNLLPRTAVTCTSSEIHA